MIAVVGLAFACEPGPRAAVQVAPPAGFLAADKQAGKPERARKAKGKAGKQAGKAKPEQHRPVKQARPAERASAAVEPPLPACPGDNALTYRSFGDGFLRTWCTGCHSSTLAEADRQSAPLAVNFDTAALYRPFARAVYERAVLEAHAIAADPAAAASPMPPAGVVPEADRRRLAQWIACGSPGA